jgi:serine/threonine protein kinase
MTGVEDGLPCVPAGNRSGTPFFMSPECQASKARDVRSDLFSLGKTLERLYDSDMYSHAARLTGLTGLLVSLMAEHKADRPATLEAFKGMTAFKGVDWAAVEDGTLEPPPLLRELAQRRARERHAIEAGQASQP